MLLSFLLSAWRSWSCLSSPFFCTFGNCRNLLSPFLAKTRRNGVRPVHSPIVSPLIILPRKAFTNVTESRVIFQKQKKVLRQINSCQLCRTGKTILFSYVQKDRNTFYLLGAFRPFSCSLWMSSNMESMGRSFEPWKTLSV